MVGGRPRYPRGEQLFEDRPRSCQGSSLCRKEDGSAGLVINLLVVVVVVLLLNLLVVVLVLGILARALLCAAKRMDLQV